MKKKREKKLALFVGAFMVLTLCMTSFVTTAEAAGFVYVPAPDGDPLIDHYNIQTALDTMGPGDTLVLEAGHYAIHKPLITVGFHGAIVGAGMDDTVIEAVSGPSGHFEAGHNPVYDTPDSQDYYTAFFLFGSPEKKLAVSDLSLEVNEEIIVERSYTLYPGDPPFYSYWDGIGFKLASGIDVSLAQNCDTSFENIRLTGVPGLGGAGSPRNGISYWYCDGGKHSLRNSILENIGTFSYGPRECSNAKFIVESNEFINGWRGTQTAWCEGLNMEIKGNTFTDMAWPGVTNYALDSSHVTVSGNSFEGCQGGVWTYNWEGNPEVGSNYIIMNNDIDMPLWSWFAGIETWDNEKSHFEIVHNTIHQESFIAPYGGICMNGVHGAVIANNEITGSGPAAMFIGTWDPYSSDVGQKIINNDVQGFELTDGLWDNYYPIVLVPIEPLGHIFLGAYSSNCIVVPGSSADTVFDAGTDNLIVQRRSRFW